MTAEADDPVGRFREDLRSAIDRYADGNVSEAARQIGIPASTLYSIAAGKEPRAESRRLIRAWLQTREVQSLPVTPPGSNEPPRRREEDPVPTARSKAIALIESLDDAQVVELLQEMRRIVARRWAREADETTNQPPEGGRS